MLQALRTEPQFLWCCRTLNMLSRKIGIEEMFAPLYHCPGEFYTNLDASHCGENERRGSTSRRNILAIAREIVIFFLGLSCLPSETKVTVRFTPQLYFIDFDHSAYTEADQHNRTLSDDFVVRRSKRYNTKYNTIALGEIPLHSGFLENG